MSLLVPTLALARPRRARRNRHRAAFLLALAVAQVVSPIHVARSQAATATSTPGDGYDWSTVEIGGGGFVTGLVTGPTGEVYARTDVGGAYRWDDAEQRWSQMLTAGGVADPEPADYKVESIAVAPSDGRVVYLAVGDDFKQPTGRILRSADGGRTWQEGGRRFAIDGNETWRQTGERLAVDPADPNVVLFGSRAEGLWRSTDGGATWTQTSLPFKVPDGTRAAPGVMFSIFHPRGATDGVSRTAWAGVAGIGVFRTDDAGHTWRRVQAVSGVPRDAEFGPDGHLYVVVHSADSHLLKIDLATSVVERVGPTTGGKLATVAVDPHQAGHLVVGETGVKDGALWRSVDGGTTWEWKRISLDDHSWPARTDIAGWMSAGELTFDPARPGTLWFAEGMGVWRTTDVTQQGVRWTFTSDGIEELVSNDAVKPSGGDLLTAHWDRGVFRHGTDGATPALTPDFMAAWDLDVADHDPSFVVAVADDNRFCCPDGARSGYSTDGGTTWHRFGSLTDGTHPDGLAFGNIAVSTGNNDTLVWAPSRFGPVHHSTDQGRTWQPAAYPGSEPHFAEYLGRQALVADPVVENTFYLLDITGMMRSTDGGATWTKAASTGLPPWWALRYDATLRAVPGRTGELLFSTGTLVNGSFGFFRSTDAGETWAELDGLRDVGSFDLGPPLAAGGPLAVYATGSLNGVTGVWRSDDDARTWHLLSTAPRGIYQGIRTVTADPDVPGKVYVGFAGNGFVAGQPAVSETISTK